jgi:tellurite resistance protein
MVVGSGRKIGDFASAVRVIYQVIRAFDNLEAAKKQYIEALAFLRGLVMVCDYLQKNKDNLGSGMEPHADTIWSHYEVLDKHLRKFVELTSKDASQFKKAFRTMKWAFVEMRERVKEMKQGAMIPWPS